MLRRILWLLLSFILLIAAGAWWALRPLPISAPTVDITIEPQTPVRSIAQTVADAGVEVDPQLLYLFFRLSGESRKLRAGSYELTQGQSAFNLLRKLSRGEENLRAVSLIDGWTFHQFRNALNNADGLRHDSLNLSDDAIMERLGMTGTPAEGRFFPDTYTYGKGSSDVRVLERAARSMRKHLAAAWAQRSPDIAVHSPDEALILASIVEKETGLETDRDMISSVFHNRLRIDMPLQTDPTVIYGLGENFDGNLRRSDLRADHPWNTYLHKGLPPTPIAMPGRNALLATLRPAHSQALYFVARGDGSSQFSNTLEEHNAAVNRYQRLTASKAK